MESQSTSTTSRGGGLRRRKRRILLALGLLTAAGAVAGAAALALRASPEERARHFLDLAEAAVLRGDADEARSFAEQAIAQGAGRRAAALVILARVDLQEGASVETVRSRLDEALEADPENGDAWLLLAGLHLEAGAHEAAEMCGAKAERFGADPAEATLVRVRAAVASGKIETGVALVDEALDALPNPTALGELAGEALRRGLEVARVAHDSELATRARAALAHWDRFLEQAAPTDVVRHEQARTRIALGEAPTAAGALDAVAVPTDTTRILRAEIALLDGRPESVPGHLTDAAETDPAVIGLLVRADVARGRFQTALRRLETTLSDNEAGATGMLPSLHAQALLGAQRDAAPRILPHVLTSSAEPERLALVPLPPETVPPAAERSLLEAWCEMLAPATLTQRDEPPAPPALVSMAAAVESALAERFPESRALQLWRAGRAVAREEGPDPSLDALPESPADPRIVLLRAFHEGSAAPEFDKQDHARRALEVAPEHPAAWSLASYLFLTGLHTEKARGACVEGLRRWPRHRPFTELWATILQASSERQDEVRRTALRVRQRVAGGEPIPEDAGVRHLLDLAAEDPLAGPALDGIWEESAAIWDRRSAATHDDESIRARLVRSARDLERAGRTSTAIDRARVAFDRAPAPDAALVLARLLIRGGDLDGADTVLGHTAVAASPEVALEHARLAHLSGDPVTAVRRLRALVASDAPLALRETAALALSGADGAAAEDVAWVQRWCDANDGCTIGPLVALHARLAARDPDALRTALDTPVPEDAWAVGWALARARAAKTLGDLIRADVELTRAPRSAAARPLAALVRLELGANAFDAGDLEAAEAWWSKARTGTPFDELAVQLQAALVARRMLRNAAGPETLPSEPLLRGQILRALPGRERAAVRAFSAALARDSGLGTALDGLVDCAIRSAAPDDAVAACRAAVRNAPWRGTVWTQLARVESAREDWAATERAARTALEREPLDAGARALLMRALHRLGRVDEAREVGAYDAEPVPARGRRAEERLLRWAVACPVTATPHRLRAFLEGEPDRFDGQLVLSRARLEAGDAEGAVRLLDEIVRARPGSTASVLLWARALHQSKGPEATRRRLAERLSEHPDDVGTLILIGMLDDARGERAAAIGRYRRAIDVEPGAHVARNNLACLLYEDAGTRREAFELIEAARQAHPDVPLFAETEGDLLLRSGNVPDALLVLTDALTRHPQVGLLHLRHAEALAQAGRTAEARGAYANALRLDQGLAKRASDELRAVVND